MGMDREKDGKRKASPGIAGSSTQPIMPSSQATPLIAGPSTMPIMPSSQETPLIAGPSTMPTVPFVWSQGLVRGQNLHAKGQLNAKLPRFSLPNMQNQWGTS
ncbi:hypothetical protein PAMP_007574 [Pampus punctatissimus]